MEELGLAQWLAGEHGRDLEAGRTRTYTGVALSDSEGGRVTVDLGGDSVTADGEQGVELPCSPNVKEGDRVTVTVVNGSPTVTGVVGGGDRTAVVIDELSGDVGEVKTIIRQYEDGVLVCKTGNHVGALVNADGSFEVIGVSWSGETPSAGNVLASFSDSAIRMGNGHVDKFVVDGNGLILGESDQPRVMIDVMGYLSLMDERGRSRVELVEYDDGSAYTQGLSFNAPGYSPVMTLETSGSEYGAGASKLKAAGNLNLAGGTNGVTLKTDGTVSVDNPSAWRSALSITPANIGAVAKSGDTMTGHLTLSGKEVRPRASLLKDGSAENVGASDGAIDFLDKDSAIIGIVRPYFDSTAQWLSIYPRRAVGGVGKINELRLGVNSSGGAVVAFNGTGAQDAWLSALGLLTPEINPFTAAQFFESTSGGTVSSFSCSRWGKLVMVNFQIAINSAWTANTQYKPLKVASGYRPATGCPFTVTTRAGMTGYYSQSSKELCFYSGSALTSGASFFVSGVFIQE